MLQLLSKSLRQKAATITHFYSMLGLVAGKSCNLWVSCNFRVLQLVGYRLYLVWRKIHLNHWTIHLYAKYLQNYISSLNWVIAYAD